MSFSRIPTYSFRIYKIIIHVIKGSQYLSPARRIPNYNRDNNKTINIKELSEHVTIITKYDNN